VVDDHPSVLDAVCRLLGERNVLVVGRSLNAREGLERIAATRPKVAVLDVALPGLGGVEAARLVRGSSPGTRVLLYTGHGTAELVDQALAAGAHGVVLKDGPLSELAAAVEVVAGGGIYVDRLLSSALVPRSGEPSPQRPLTPRERDVLRLVADGSTNEQVGERLSISADTVQTHVRNAMKKLGAESRTQAVATAMRQALIS
jgi:DNA-binding NarL/FixJ family response regulator